MDEEKKTIRAQIRRLRAQMTREEIGQRSLEIWQRVLESGAYRSCSVIYIYMSLPGEAETRTLIQRAWEDGKKVAVPKTDLEKRQLHFYEIRHFGQVKPGVMGILEPSDTAILDPLDFEKPLFIMPGLAFCRDGRRVGYGGGYYDRYLEKRRGIMRVALACSFQILPSGCVPCPAPVPPSPSNTNAWCSPQLNQSSPLPSRVSYHDRSRSFLITVAIPYSTSEVFFSAVFLSAQAARDCRYNHLIYGSVNAAAGPDRIDVGIGPPAYGRPGCIIGCKNNQPSGCPIQAVHIIVFQFREAVGHVPGVQRILIPSKIIQRMGRSIRHDNNNLTSICARSSLG